MGRDRDGAGSVGSNAFLLCPFSLAQFRRSSQLERHAFIFLPPWNSQPGAVFTMCPLCLLVLPARQTCQHYSSHTAKTCICQPLCSFFFWALLPPPYISLEKDKDGTGQVMMGGGHSLPLGGEKPNYPKFWKSVSCLFPHALPNQGQGGRAVTTMLIPPTL